MFQTRLLDAKRLLTKTGFVSILDHGLMWFLQLFIIEFYLIIVGYVCVCVHARMRACVHRRGEWVLREGGNGRVSVWPEYRGLPTAWKRNETPCNLILLQVPPGIT